MMTKRDFWRILLLYSDTNKSRRTPHESRFQHTYYYTKVYEGGGKLLPCFFALVIFALVAASCAQSGSENTSETPEQESPTVTSIQLSSNPAKTAYNQNETFDPAGLVIYVNWSDGTASRIKYDQTTSADFTFSGASTSTMGTKTVTVSYKGKTCTFSITVTAANSGTNDTPDDSGENASNNNGDSGENNQNENNDDPAGTGTDPIDSTAAQYEASLTPGYYATVSEYPRTLYAPGDAFSADGLYVNIYRDDGTLYIENMPVWDLEIRYTMGNDTTTIGDHTVTVYCIVTDSKWNDETSSYDRETFQLKVSYTITVRAVTADLYPAGTIYTDELETFDYASYGDLALSVPQGSTSVDVKALYEARETAQEKAAAQTARDGIERTVTYAAYPETVTKFVIKNNIDLMNMVSEPDFTNANEGDNLYTDLVPGIKVLSNLAVAYASGNKNIQKALSFTDTTKKVDLSATDYSLTGTYKGGIVGNVEFENLEKTKISGTIEGKSNISPFYDTFVKNTRAENLPSLSLDFEGFDADFGEDVALGGTYVNMYGTNIDKIVSKYYDNSKTIEFSGGSMSFNAKEKLGTESMYTSNVYNNNAYNLDINAALVMNPLIANVNVVGNRNSNVPTELSQSLTNVRFESDLNGVSLTGAERGVIEFAGDAPDSNGDGPRVIFNGTVSSETYLGSSDSVDVSALSTTEAARLKSRSTASTITEVVTNSSNAKPTGFLISNTVVGAENATYSSQDWEKTGNQGKEHPSQADLSYALPKKNVKPTKSDLIRAILDENQKQYS